MQKCSKYYLGHVQTTHSHTDIWTISFMFVIMKTLHCIRLGSVNSPFFYDDKPNDHIDIKGKNKLVPKQSSQVENIFEQINSNQVKLKQLWSYLSSPFWHHRKRVVKENRLNQGVGNHHHLGSGGNKRQPAIHSSIWYGNDIGHPSNTQTINSLNRAQQKSQITKIRYNHC